MGVPWLEELPATSVEAYLVAAARVVAPTYAADDIDLLGLQAVAQYEPLLAKALSRKQRRQLEQVGSRLAGSRPPPPDAFVLTLSRLELRTAYLVSGDLLATVDEIRQWDPALYQATVRSGPRSLGAILEHPVAGDVCRFAVSAEATALRRRLGSIWT
jgi:hypothetical protein